MIQLGKFQDLYIVKKKEFGVYVNDQKDVTDGSILLPAKQVPDGARIGDQISCFVYKDSEDRPIATVHIPKITLVRSALYVSKKLARLVLSLTGD